MKKRHLMIIIMIIIAALFTMTACGNSANTDTTTQSQTTTTEIGFTPEELILAYCNGTWDGKFISGAEHCASIEAGVLWIDCRDTKRIPDIGPYDDTSYYYEVIAIDEGVGTWLYNSKASILELWLKGFRKELLPLYTDSAISTSVYKLTDGFVIRCGSSLKLLNEFGVTQMVNFLDVLDVQETPEGVWFSTFEYENYLITGVNDEVKKLATNYIRFPNEPGTIVKSDDIRLAQAFNLFYGEGWDGTCRRLDSGDFIDVDYYGNIIVNNEIIGNVCLGDSVVDSDGPNIYLEKDRSYYLDGKQLVYFEHGPIEKKADIPDGTGKFLWVSTQYDDDGSEVTDVTIAAQSGDTVYIVFNDGTVRLIASNVVDANVAYDTLYYMVGNVVYALDWLDPEAKSEVFFDGAYAVSHHKDETEGAIVPSEKANYSGYGYSNLYSPYGK